MNSNLRDYTPGFGEKKVDLGNWMRAYASLKYVYALINGFPKVIFEYLVKGGSFSPPLFVRIE